MKNIIRTLKRAIDKSAIVEIEYKGLIYQCEFYLIWENADKVKYVHGWKRSGGWIKTEGPHWFNMFVREITSVKRIGDFIGPLEGFNPKSKMFYKILYCWRYKK